MPGTDIASPMRCPVLPQRVVLRLCHILGTDAAFVDRRGRGGWGRGRHLGIGGAPAVPVRFFTVLRQLCPVAHPTHCPVLIGRTAVPGGGFSSSDGGSTTDDTDGTSLRRVRYWRTA
eukprot:798346-Rhodomonas_salina.1